MEKVTSPGCVQNLKIRGKLSTAKLTISALCLQMGVGMTVYWLQNGVTLESLGILAGVITGMITLYTFTGHSKRKNGAPQINPAMMQNALNPPNRNLPISGANQKDVDQIVNDLKGLPFVGQFLAGLIEPRK